MRLSNSWSLLLKQEFNNFKKQCIADYEEVVAEYKRFEVATEKDYGIDPTTTQKRAHVGNNPFDYDDPLRAYEAFLADELLPMISTSTQTSMYRTFSTSTKKTTAAIRVMSEDSVCLMNLGTNLVTSLNLIGTRHSYILISVSAPTVNLNVIGLGNSALYSVCR